jgi:hypothetical protein
MIEPVAVKTEVSFLGENVEVSVNEANKGEQSKGFVKVNRVFMSE